MKKLILLLCLLTSFVFASESDHPQSYIKGKGIELITKGHTIAGIVNGKMILGDVPENRHKSSNLVVKGSSGFETTNFGNNNGTWGGMLNNTQVKLLSLDKTIPAYFIEIQGKKYRVRVESDSFANNHFINPTYILELSNGDEVEARMEKGQACYMYSLHLIFMIFGTFLI